jgi:hypothetical protein
MDARTQTVAEVAERLAVVERCLRRRRYIGLAFLMVLGAAGALGATRFDATPIFDAVRTREFNVLATEGRVRAQVRVGADDSVALALLDAEGYTRASLVVLPNGSPRLRLYGKRQDPRAGLEIGEDGAGAATLAASDGTLYFQSVSRTMRELPAVEGVRLRKPVTVSGIEAAPEAAYQLVDAERPPRQ